MAPGENTPTYRDMLRERGPLVGQCTWLRGEARAVRKATGGGDSAGGLGQTATHQARRPGLGRWRRRTVAPLHRKQECPLPLKSSPPL